MPVMHGMTHLSRGLLLGLQHPHVSSLDASHSYQPQPGLSLPTSQGTAAQPYALPQTRPYSHTAHPPMVMPFPCSATSPV